MNSRTFWVRRMLGHLLIATIGGGLGYWTLSRVFLPGFLPEASQAKLTVLGVGLGVQFFGMVGVATLGLWTAIGLASRKLNIEALPPWIVFDFVGGGLYVLTGFFCVFLA